MSPREPEVTDRPTPQGAVRSAPRRCPSSLASTTNGGLFARTDLAPAKRWDIPPGGARATPPVGSHKSARHVIVRHQYGDGDMRRGDLHDRSSGRSPGGFVSLPWNCDVAPPQSFVEVSVPVPRPFRVAPARRMIPGRELTSTSGCDRCGQPSSLNGRLSAVAGRSAQVRGATSGHGLRVEADSYVTWLIVVTTGFWLGSCPVPHG